jgi:hypothetical protein
MMDMEGRREVTQNTATKGLSEVIIIKETKEPHATTITMEGLTEGMTRTDTEGPREDKITMNRDGTQ